MKIRSKVILAAVLMTTCLFYNLTVSAENTTKELAYEKVTLASEDGLYVVQADYFKAKDKRAVILVPGARFSSSSWFFIAEKLQQMGISSISIDGSSVPNVLAAISFLKKQGFEHIALVGGSMGGGSVLSALKKNKNSQIKKVVVLAPYGGEPIKDETIKKLFIVAENDNLGIFDQVKANYENSNDPKVLKIYDGSEHAQHLFKTKYKKELTELIITFIAGQ